MSTSAVCRIAMLLAAGALLAPAGCTTALDECRRQYPTGSAAYQACFEAELARENQRLNQLHASEYRGRQ
jgi:hypothetical protein